MAAETASLGIAVGLGETDNVFLAPSGTRSQTIATTELDFGLKRAGSPLTADLRGDFRYFDYLQHAYNNQILGRFDGRAAWSVWAERLRWVVQDDYGEAQLNPFIPVTPLNLEHVNVASTGPDLVLRPTLDILVRLGARYSLSSYETSPFDGHRVTGTLALERLLSDRSSVSLQAEAEQLRFHNTTVNSDYDRERLYASYEAQGARTELTIYGGVTRANEGGTWTSTPLARLELSRKLSPAASLKLSGGRQFTDQADSFRDLRAGALGGIAIPPIALTSTGNYLSSYASAECSLQGVRTTVALSARWERDAYALHNALDLEYGNAQLKVGRQMSRTLTGELYGSAATTHYLNEGLKSQDYLIGAGLVIRPARRIEIKVRYAHQLRNASGGGLEYRENGAFVTVGYRPLVSESGGALEVPVPGRRDTEVSRTLLLHQWPPGG